jgi:hypothetical protein
MSQQNEILQELEAWQSPLAKLPRTMPFMVPDGYFNRLPAEISGALDQGDLTVYRSRRQPFEVPEQYFEQLPAMILSKVRAEGEQKPKTIDLRKSILKQLRWAAAAVLLLAAGAGIWRASVPSSFERQLASLPEDVVADYVEQHIDEFDPELIESVALEDAPVPTLPLTEEEINNHFSEEELQ